MKKFWCPKCRKKTEFGCCLEVVLHVTIADACGIGPDGEIDEDTEWLYKISRDSIKDLKENSINHSDYKPKEVYCKECGEAFSLQNFGNNFYHA